MANAGKLSVMLLAVGASIALSFTAYAGGLPFCGDGEVNGTEVCDGSASPDGCTSRQTCNSDCTACVAVPRITLCHQPSPQAKAVTVRVPANAVAAHLAHGDTLGACP